MGSSAFRSTIFFSCMVASVLIVAPAIDNHRFDYLSRQGVSGEDLLYKIFGETRKILSMQAYIAGDEYFHGGISRYFMDESERVKCAHIEHATHEHDGHACECEHHHEHEREHHQKHLHKEDKVVGISKFNILPYVGEIVHVGKHVHLMGEEEKEMLPWFYYAVRLDPQNIEAYRIGGYWVGRRMSKADEGIKFLKEGILHNPGSWELYAQLANIYFWEKEDYDEALLNYEKALTRLNDANSDKFDKRLVYDYAALCYEKFGNIPRAVELYKKILLYFPNDERLRKKIITLSPNN